jgi:restriction system protein
LGRKRDGGPLGDLFELAALFPWWVGVSLALASYVLLHMYAVAPIAAPGNVPGQLGAFAASHLWKGLASIGQYLVPLALVGGAIASAITRYRRRSLVSDVAAGKSPSVLLDMSWREFEALVSEAFRLDGYTVEERRGEGPDGGVDLVLRKASERFLVQCKQWRALKVSVTIVRELYGVMAAQGATGGFVVTSGAFTSDAVAFADGRNIALIDGDKLFAMFDRVRSATSTKPAAQMPPNATEPNCPNCGKAMVKRIAKKGSNAGNAFWGCPGYPGCRGIRTID